MTKINLHSAEIPRTKGAKLFVGNRVRFMHTEGNYPCANISGKYATVLEIFEKLGPNMDTGEPEVQTWVKIEWDEEVDKCFNPKDPLWSIESFGGWWLVLPHDGKKGFIEDFELE